MNAAAAAAAAAVRRTRATLSHHQPPTKSLLLFFLSTRAAAAITTTTTTTSSSPSDISTFLRTTAPPPSWETLTAAFESLHLTPPLVETVLLDLKEPLHAKKALTFFHWSSKRSPSYRHSLRSYCLLVHILVRAGLLLDARALLESAILYGDSPSGPPPPPPPPPLFEALWATYEAVVPGSRVFDLLVQTYSKMRLLDLAFAACSYFSDRGFASSLISFNSVLRAAAKSNANALAWKVFEYMLQRRVYPNQTTVETMISLMCKEGSLLRMASAVDKIRGKKQCAPGVVVNVALALRIVDEGRVEEGVLLLKRMLQKNMVFDDIVHSLVIYSYCKRGALKSADERREEMINKGCSMNAFVYTCFIGAHCDRGDIEASVKLAHEMVSVGLKPYDETYNHLIVGCFKAGRMEEGLAYVEKMLKDGFLPDSSTCNEMMGALCESRDVNKANELLTEFIGRGFVPDEGTYLVLIDGYGKIEEAEGIVRLYYEMEHRGLNPGPAVFTAVIQSFCKCGKLNRAEKFLAVMRQKSLAPTSCIYDALVAWYCETGNKKRALQFYDEMTRNELIPSADTFMTLAKKMFEREHETESGVVGRSPCRTQSLQRQHSSLK